MYQGKEIIRPLVLDSSSIHTPVLLNDVVEVLGPQLGGRYIDATVNGGGHASAIADRIGEDGALLGIDKDNNLIERLKIKWSSRSNLTAVCGSYANIDKIAELYGFSFVNGILFDLGFSSYHIDQSRRGFSFLRDEPLDMRYDTENNQLTAMTIVNTWPESELSRIAAEYGQERFARKIAAIIINERKKKQIRTTFDLMEVIKKSIPIRLQHGKIHPATRMFQALRIAVNNELGDLREGLEKSINLLVNGGKIVIISFHSLEDGIVKTLFREKEKQGVVHIITKKPIKAYQQEIYSNPRSRSAKLRAISKL